MNDLAVRAPDPRTATGTQFVEASMPAPRRDHRGSTIAGRRPDDFVFEPRDSTFFFEKTVELASKPIQIAFERTFERCQLALFEFEMIAPIIAHDDDGVRAVNAALDKKMRSFETFVEGERNRINKILEDNGKQLNRGEFTKPREFTVKVYTPRVSRYLEMLQLADEMIATYGRAWLEGFMDEINFKRMVFAIRMRTINLAREVWELHTRSFYALRKQRKAKDEERQRLIDARAAARAAKAAKRLETDDQDPDATDTGDEHDSAIAQLEATVAHADRIIETVEQRGGMEETAPDFGRADLAAESPQLMADAEGGKRSRTRGAATAAGAEPAAADA